MNEEKTFSQIKKIKIKIATKDDILSWSYGEVFKPETINYRTFAPEKDGLFDERIFGPLKDYECRCGKYKKVRFKGIICDRCGVEVTRAVVRRERMGHISLASPVTHIWFVKQPPSIIGSILNKSFRELEKVIYFTHYIILSVDERLKKEAIKRIESEFKLKLKEIEDSKKLSKSQKNKKIQELNELRKKEREKIESLKPLKIISEAEYISLSQKYGEVFEAGIGADALKKILERIKPEDSLFEITELLKDAKGQERKKLLKRLKVIKSLIKNNISYTDLILEIIPVIPPDLRPIVQLDGGRFASSDINDLYRRIINRNNRLKRLIEIKAPEIIIRNEKRMLQEAVDALFDNQARKGKEVRQTGGQRRILKSLADLLRGKEGRFRQNLLGKRVDYSGRSVITVGPHLKLGECAIPKHMLLEIFKPFVIGYLVNVKETASNIKSAIRLIEEQSPVVWDALEKIIKDKLLLLNRAPSLHRLSIQAFKPKMTEAKTIQIHPLVCEGYNADFDGDQMAVFLPLTDEAQKEAKELMFSVKNLLKPASGHPITNPTKDIVLGIYWLSLIINEDKKNTKLFNDFKEALAAYDHKKIDLREKIKVYVSKNSIFIKKRNIKPNSFVLTSVGRIIFNSILPEDFDFINEKLTKKSLQKITSTLILEYGFEKAVEYIEKIKDLGFKFSTISGITWGMNDIVIPKEKQNIVKKAEKESEKIQALYEEGYLTESERKIKTIEIWLSAIDEISKAVPNALDKFGPIYAIFDSGSRGSWGQAVQMGGIKGIMTDPKGELIEVPIKNSFKEGLKEFEYFISAHGARKGVTDTALKTSVAGYLTRRLVDVSHDVIIREEDCNTLDGIYIDRQTSKEMDIDFKERLWGRVLNEDIEVNKEHIKRGTLIDKKLAEKIENSKLEKVFVRSPIFCKTRNGICSMCFGLDLGRNELVKVGEAVGIIGAQSIGEPGTQLTMRTFHIGGVAGKDITQGLPRIEEIFEARKPKNEALISPVDGKIKKIKKLAKDIEIEIEYFDKHLQKNQVLRYTIPQNKSLLVKEGDLVSKGQCISSGDIDLHMLYQYKGLKETVKYIIKEITNVYSSQGVSLNEKYIELVAKKMFSRVRILESGDSDFIPGEIIERDVFDATNEKLIKTGRRPAKGKVLLLGITKVALTCDSFLSAASFQETTRVLVKAALEGKIDYLRGLKENVIIGGLIPAGEHYRKIYYQKKELKKIKVKK